MDAYDLKPLWSAILAVYKEIYQICERHDLRVYAAFGTAIGAMRHKGFIPWDDDFDIYMPRPDYERFMTYAKTELPPYMKWHSIENDPMHGLLFGKVCDERACQVESVSKASNLALGEGIFVDVFPLDGLPSSRIGVFAWAIARSFLRRYAKKLATLQSFTKLFNYDKCVNIGWCHSGMGWCNSSSGFPKYVYKKSWFEGRRMVSFEGIDIPVPKQVEEYLNSVYDDYLKLPPPDQRHPTHQLSRH